MRFTVNLANDTCEGSDFSYGLAFVPSPVWVKGDRAILNLNSDDPSYQCGSLLRLLEEEGIDERFSSRGHMSIIVHELGYGTEEDLRSLQEDGAKEGFAVSVFRNA